MTSWNKKYEPPPLPNPYPPSLKWPSPPEKQSMNSNLKSYGTLSIFSILPATTASWKAKYICSTHKTLTHTNRPASDTNSHLVILHAANGMQTCVGTSAAALPRTWVFMFLCGHQCPPHPPTRNQGCAEQSRNKLLHICAYKKSLTPQIWIKGRFVLLYICDNVLMSIYIHVLRGNFISKQKANFWHL